MKRRSSRLLHLLRSVVGTTRLCPDVRDQGEYWRVSGPRLEHRDVVTDLPIEA
jgi:hypothetical protein